jgi:hypothetical protein
MWLIPKYQIAGKRRSTPHFPGKPNACQAPITLSDQVLASSSQTTLQSWPREAASWTYQSYAAWQLRISTRIGL